MLLKILILLQIPFFILLIASCEQPTEEKIERYTGTETWRNGELTVEVGLSGTIIKSIEVEEHIDTPVYVTMTTSSLPNRIVSAHSLSVDVVSGATLTSNRILEAVEDALIKRA